MPRITNDTQNGHGKWVKYIEINGELFVTKSAAAWYNMRQRCNARGYVQKNHHTYVGCEMSEGFKDFQVFTAWHMNQVGYCFTDYNLDKDILFRNNKLYSEDTCVLIPKQLNSFLTASDAIRGALPQGVYYDKQACKYKAQINCDGKVVNLGRYFTVSAAREAYKIAKEAEARRWHQRLVGGEFVVDVRVIERMRTWEHICNWEGLHD